MMFTSSLVSILACKNLVLVLCGFTLTSRFVSRCCGAGQLVLACLACNFICKQNDSSLEWPHLELSCVDNLLLINWYVLFYLDWVFLKDSCFL